MQPAHRQHPTAHRAHGMPMAMTMTQASEPSPGQTGSPEPSREADAPGGSPAAPAFAPELPGHSWSGGSADDWSDGSGASQASGATATLVQIDTETEAEAASTKPKKLPPYQVVLLNDEDHTYEYVITLLMKVFRVELKKAFTLTRRIDQHGRAAVWTGSKEVAELKQDQVKSFGPDHFAAESVTFPLGCLIEPMPT